MQKNSPAWGLGTGNRKVIKGPDAPGPGNYEIRKSVEGPMYSIGGKFEERIKDSAPGPGNY